MDSIIAMIVAQMSLDEYSKVERLVEDIERTGHKRGQIVRCKDGSLNILWKQGVGGGSVGSSGDLKISKQ